ncbi:hypothetical protein AGLY_008052 [Aphis glycines]|uniref:Uncharacterized protein n=1 Tax=Aphis glycines TaxID=307491 RepID=A0A6G0TN04_APHGL|nr:hypothetical protein AGLY_008052 [Aphis glycines]
MEIGHHKCTCMLLWIPCQNNGTINTICRLTIVKKNNNIPPFAVLFNTENHNMKIKNCYLCILMIVQADFVLIVSASRIMDKFKSESLCVKSDSIMSSNISNIGVGPNGGTSIRGEGLFSLLSLQDCFLRIGGLIGLVAIVWINNFMIFTIFNVTKHVNVNNSRIMEASRPSIDTHLSLYTDKLISLNLVMNACFVQSINISDIMT